MTKLPLLLSFIFIISCADKIIEDKIEAARKQQNKVNETESRFDKLYNELDKETK